MSQICCSDVLLKNSIQAVVEPLKEGLGFIKQVFNALIDEDADPFTGQSCNYNFIREQIVEAKQSLERSEQVASAGLKSLDENIELLIRDEGKLEREMRETDQTLKNLRTEQESDTKLLNLSKGSLEVSRGNLDSARKTLRGQEQKKITAGIVTGVGAGLFVIPVVGWIAGTAMVIGGAIGLDQAFDAVREAEEEVRNSESQVETYRSKVSDYSWRISKTEKDIRGKHDRIQQIRSDIQRVKKESQAVADIQQKVRKAVRILSALSGRASVVEAQTRIFILLEPVMKVMEEVMKAAGAIDGSQLLYGGGLPKLLDTLREKHDQAVRKTEQNSSGDLSLYY